jgi:hypothetical protein
MHISVTNKDLAEVFEHIKKNEPLAMLAIEAAVIKEDKKPWNNVSNYSEAMMDALIKYCKEN